MYRALLPAGLLIALLAHAACVPSEDRVPDSAELRDPWELPAEGSDAAHAAGRSLFASCASCHLADGSGRPDGTIPRLAGQDAAVLERRLLALRDGSVDLPVMTPFARAVGEREIREVSGYLASLPPPKHIGFGSGRQLDRGAAVYRSYCQACHASDGLGQPALNAPRLCGQHAPYLLRRLNESQGSDPRAVDPTMRAIVASLSDEDLAAVADHLSRGSCD